MLAYQDRQESCLLYWCSWLYITVEIMKEKNLKSKKERFSDRYFLSGKETILIVCKLTDSRHFLPLEGKQQQQAL